LHAAYGCTSIFISDFTRSINLRTILSSQSTTCPLISAIVCSKSDHFHLHSACQGKYDVVLCVDGQVIDQAAPECLVKPVELYGAGINREDAARIAFGISKLADWIEEYKDDYSDDNVFFD
jgi:hypothetical protein